MPHFPTDAPKNRVVRALERLGYRIIRERNHICMARENPDGSRSVLVLPIKNPNHSISLYLSFTVPDASV